MPVRAALAPGPALPGGGLPPPQHVRFRLRRLATGAVLDLATPSWRVLAGAYGLDDLATEIIAESAAGGSGTTILGQAYPPRDVFLPLSTRRDRLDGLREARAELRRIAPSGETIRLEMVSDSASGEVVRWADCRRVSDGSTSWDTDTWSAEGWQRFGLRLYCPDPWVHSDPLQWEWSAPSSGLRFPMRFPMRLGPPNLLGRARQLSVVGDARSHGVWTLRGPCSAFTATLPATGETWTLTPPTPLTTGQTVQVFTDPLVARDGLRVIGPDGSSWWRYVSAPRAIWAVPPETPEVLVQMTGTSSASRAVLRVTPRWEAFL